MRTFDRNVPSAAPMRTFQPPPAHEQARRPFRLGRVRKSARFSFDQEVSQAPSPLQTRPPALIVRSARRTTLGTVRHGSTRNAVCNASAGDEFPRIHCDLRQISLVWREAKKNEKTGQRFLECLGRGVCRDCLAVPPKRVPGISLGGINEDRACPNHTLYEWLRKLCCGMRAVIEGLVVGITPEEIHDTRPQGRLAQGRLLEILIAFRGGV